MKTLTLFTSLGNFNTQEEYDEYQKIPVLDTAEDDMYHKGVAALLVGYSKVVIIYSDNGNVDKCIYHRKEKNRDKSLVCPLCSSQRQGAHPVRP